MWNWQLKTFGNICVSIVKEMFLYILINFTSTVNLLAIVFIYHRSANMTVVKMSCRNIRDLRNNERYYLTLGNNRHFIRASHQMSNNSTRLLIACAGGKHWRSQKNDNKTTAKLYASLRTLDTLISFQAVTDFYAEFCYVERN